MQQQPPILRVLALFIVTFLVTSITHSQSVSGQSPDPCKFFENKNVYIEFDETGSMIVKVNSELSSVKSKKVDDTLPGGLPKSMTYDLSGLQMTCITAGDLIMTEQFESATSDVVRFTTSSIIFDSDNSDKDPPPPPGADNGLPTSYQSNTKTVKEGPMGSLILADGIQKYRPAPGEPGFFLCGDGPEYRIWSDGTAGGIVGDPQFVGLRGQRFQVHGVSGYVYNIVSDNDFQYNSRFVFLDHGDCPILNGKKAKGCFSHLGSYLGEIGIKTRAGDKIHLLTGPARTGFKSMKVNEQSIGIGETILLADDIGSVTCNSTHLTTMVIGDWLFEFENSDMYLNQRVTVHTPLNRLRSHGLLGQTWRTTTYNNPIKFIEGTIDDYAIRGKDIYGDDFIYNTFN